MFAVTVRRWPRAVVTTITLTALLVACTPTGADSTAHPTPPGSTPTASHTPGGGPVASPAGLARYRAADSDDERTRLAAPLARSIAGIAAALRNTG